MPLNDAFTVTLKVQHCQKLRFQVKYGVFLNYDIRASLAVQALTDVSLMKIQGHIECLALTVLSMALSIDKCFSDNPSHCSFSCNRTQLLDSE